MKVFKKLLAAVLTLAMVISYAPQFTVAEEIELWESETSLPENVTGNAGKTYKLTKDVVLGKAMEYGSVTAGLTIDLNGYTVTSEDVNSNAGVFIFNGEGTHTIKDSSTEQTGRLIGPDSQLYVIRVYGSKGAVLNYEGGIIDGADNTVSRCAIYLDGGITGENPDSIKYPTLNMSGGKITGFEVATDTSKGINGAAIMSDGTKPVSINISGGEISENTSIGGSGAAVNINNGTVTVSGGLFKDNLSETYTYNNGTKDVTIGGYGGAIRIGTNGTPAITPALTVTGGTFTGNEAFNGGAIFTAAGVNGAISDCVITGNSADTGGGILCQGVVTLTGAPVIKSNTASKYPNVYVAALDGAGNASVVTNGLTEGADVVISLSASRISDILAGTELAIGLAASGDEEYISSDNDMIAAKVSEGSLIFYKTVPADSREYQGNIYYKWDNASALPTEGYWYLDKDIKLDAGTEIGAFFNKNLAVDLNGHTIDLDGKYDFRVNQSNITVSFLDSTTTYDEDGLFVSGGKIINGSNGYYGCFYNNKVGSVINLTGIEITGCKATAGADGFNAGALCVRTGGQANITGCYIHGNTSIYSGAALTVIGTADPNADTTLTVTDTRIEENQANPYLKDDQLTGGEGGALYLNNSAHSKAILENCVITKNSGYHGSAIYASTESYLTLKDCLITENTAAIENSAYAGAVYLLSTDASKKVLEGSNVIRDNVNGSGSIADLCLQNTNTVFTLKNPASDTFMNITSPSARGLGETVGTLVGDMAGKINWRKSTALYIENAEGTLKLAEHKHEDTVYNAWYSSTSLPKKGNYYLTGDVTVKNQHKLEGNLNLDLNGYTVKKAADIWGILVIDRGTEFDLNITSCRTGGTIMNTVTGAKNALLGSFAAKTTEGVTTEGSKGNISISDVTITGVDGLATGICLCIQGSVNLNLNNCVFTGNKTKGADEKSTSSAAAIFTDTTGQINIKDCEFTGNSADGTGGAIRFNNTAARAVIDGCEFTENSAANGGAIWANKGAVIAISNSVFTNNTVTTDGSAILHNNSDLMGTLSLDNVTITNNTCDAVNKEAIYFNTGTIILDGKVVINGNVSGSAAGDIKLSKSGIIKIGSKGLDPESKVDIYVASLPADGIIVRDVKSDVASCFTLTNQDMSLVYNATGQTIGINSHSHDGKIFMEWTDSTKLPTKNPAGYDGYYLTCDVTVAPTSANALTGNLNLCLNGHTIATTSTVFGAVYSIARNTDYNLSIISCVEGGEITYTGTADRTGFAIGSYAAVSKDGVVTTPASRGSITLENIKISGFKGVAGCSVAIQGETAFTANSCEFTGNNSTTGAGSALYASTTGQVMVNVCTFTDNQGTAGSAISASSVTPFTMQHCTVTGNKDLATNTKAGAVKVAGTNKKFIGANIISGNSNSAANPIPANLYVTSGSSVEVDTRFCEAEIYFNSDAPFTEIGTYVGDALTGEFVWTSNANKEIVAENGKIVLADRQPHTHDGKTYKVWNSFNTLPTGNPTDADGYYLAGDIHVVNTYSVKGNLDVCLDGHEIFQDNPGKYGTFRIDNTTPAGTVANITDCTLMGGFNGGNDPEREGALLFSNGTATDSTFRVSNVNFVNGNGSASGHMVTIQGAANAEFYKCVFEGNTAENGAAIYKSGTGKLIVDSCYVTGNTATGTSGGAIYVNGTGLAEINDSVFAWNEAPLGRASILFGGTNENNIIEGCKFNLNAGAITGGIGFSSAAVAEVKDCSFFDNVKDPENEMASGQDICISSVSSTTYTGQVLLNGLSFSGTLPDTIPVNIGSRTCAEITGTWTADFTGGSLPIIYVQERAQAYVNGANFTGFESNTPIVSTGTLYVADSDISGDIVMDASQNMWMIQMTSKAIVSGKVKANFVLTENSDSWYSRQEGGEAEKAILIVQGAELDAESEVYVLLSDGGDPADYVFGPVETQPTGENNRYLLKPGQVNPGEIIHEDDQYYYNLEDQMTIGKDLSLTFILDSDDDEAYMTFERNGQEFGETDVNVVRDGNSWTLLGISPRSINDEYVVRVYSCENREKDKFNYSAVNYLEAVLDDTIGKTDDESVATAKYIGALIDLSEKTGLYTDYIEEGTISPDLVTWIDENVVKAERPVNAKEVTQNSKTKGIKINSASLHFSEGLWIDFKFTANTDTCLLLEKWDGVEWATVIASDNTVDSMLTLPEINGCTLTKAGSKYVLRTDKLFAYENNTVYRFTLLSGDTVNYQVTYSADSYIDSYWDDENLGDVVKSLNNYGYAAQVLAGLE